MRLMAHRGAVGLTRSGLLMKELPKADTIIIKELDLGSYMARLVFSRHIQNPNRLACGSDTIEQRHEAVVHVNLHVTVK